MGIVITFWVGESMWWITPTNTSIHLGKVTTRHSLKLRGAVLPHLTTALPHVLCTAPKWIDLLIQFIHQISLLLAHSTTKNPNPSQKHSHCIDRVGLGFYLLKRGLERREKKLLRPGAVAVISNIEGGLAAAAALPETSNARPNNGDGVGTRGEREARASTLGVREREGKELLRTWG